MTAPAISIEIANADAVITGIDRRLKLAVTNVARALDYSVREVWKQLAHNVPKVTHTLERSWSMRPVSEIRTGNDRLVGFEAGMGSRLVYAPIVEYGYDGPVRAHIRHVRGRDIRAKEMVPGNQTVVNTMVAHERTPSRKVLTAVGITFVKAHHRKQRAHPYAVPALMSSIPKIEAMNRAALEATRQGVAY